MGKTQKQALNLPAESSPSPSELLDADAVARAARRGCGGQGAHCACSFKISGLAPLLRVSGHKDQEWVLGPGTAQGHTVGLRRTLATGNDSCHQEPPGKQSGSEHAGRPWPGLHGRSPQTALINSPDCLPSLASGRVYRIVNAYGGSGGAHNFKVIAPRWAGFFHSGSNQIRKPS